MKYILPFLFVVLTANLSAQTDSVSKARTIDLEFTYVCENVNNVAGGIKTGSNLLGMANLTLNFNFEQAKLWRGGELQLNLASTHGATPSANLLGDYQVASNIDAGNLIYFLELFYRQSFGKASFIAGLQDLNANFVVTEYGGLFSNSSFGIFPTISSNLEISIFPATALGFEFHYQFTDNFCSKIALYDGLPDAYTNNPLDIKWSLSKNDGYFAITEYIYTTGHKTRPSTFKAGAYFHNEHQITETLENVPVTTLHDSNYGFYFIAEKTLLKTDEGKEFGIFGQLGIAPKKLNYNWLYTGLGMNYKGIIGKRSDDVLGLAVNHAFLSGEIGNETTIELTYQAVFGEHLFVQPDFQYIINPAGTDIKLPNAFAAMVRVGLAF